MKAYLDGARAGAPQAIQVADRFHLLQNLAEALDQVFSAHGKTLKTVSEAPRHTPVVQPDGRTVVPVPPSTPPPRPRPGPPSGGPGGSRPMNRCGRCPARVGPIAPSLSHSALVA